MPSNGLQDATGAPCPPARRGQLVGALALACGAILAGSALAADTEPEEGLILDLRQSFVWDDNVFHLPENRAPEPGRSRDDRISRTSAGLRFEHTYSLQRIAAALNVSERRFAENKRLNSTATSGSLRWDWAIGSQWTGMAVLLQREAPRSFSDVDRRVRSVNTLRRASFDADYWWHPDWSAVMGAEHTRSRYSDRESAGAEYDETAVEGGLGYRPSSGNRLSLVLREARGDYPNRGFSTTVDSGYKQHDVRLRGTWTPTGHSRFSGYVGYTWRRYRNLSQLDYDGPTARLVYDWTPTGKLSLTTVVRSELGSEVEVVDNYVLSRGFTISPKWTVTDKVAVHGLVDWVWRDFGSTRLSSVDEDQRKTVGLRVVYEPTRTISIGLSGQRTWRLAPGTAFDYTANVYGVEIGLEL